MKKMTLIFLMLCMLASCAMAEALPAPAAMPTVDGFEPVALYCGPTQGFYRYAEQTIDLTQPFVSFGTYDCWTMVAQGTPDSFGPVGWIEGGLFTADLPELGVEDGFAAMVEESAPLTNDPLNAEAFWDITLAYGTPITVLAESGDFLYIQAEVDGTPIRAFIPKNTVY